MINAIVIYLCVLVPVGNIVLAIVASTDRQQISINFPLHKQFVNALNGLTVVNGTEMRN
jgi:hypothetical protein